MDDRTPRPLSVEIPSQSLPQALNAFADQTGLQLVYLSTLAAAARSQSVPAGLTSAEALTRMLSGTGIGFIFLNDHTVKLFKEVPPATFAAHPATHMPPPLAALDEVIVTATKREELLRDVPISATVLSGEAMEQSGVTSIADIAAMTPGVEYDFNAQWGGGVLTNLAIRGIDSKVGASTTGIYINDAPIQARNGNFGNPYPATFDLARVEVLRGPQGTLFGAGAEGGSIRFITNEASTSITSALSRVEFASTEHGGPSYELGTAVGGPLVEGRLGARFAAWYRQDAGYIDRVDPFNGSPVERNSNGVRTEAFRLSFAVEPDDALRITPLLAYESLRIGDTSSFYEYLTTPADGLFRNGKLLSQPVDNSFMLASTHVEYHFRSADLTAVSSYFDRTESATVDSTNEAGAVFYGGFGNPLGAAYPSSYADAVPTLTSLHQIVLSEEVRLMSSDRFAAVRWTAGVFFSRARQDERQYTYPIAEPMNPGVYSNEDYTDTVGAGFGNLDLSITRSWRIRLGLRVDHARSEFSQYAGGFADVGAPPFSHAVTGETPITPQFDVEYESADHSLAYATVAKGFRVGGINTALPIQCGVSGVPPSYASDSVWSYEVGTKRRLFDDHLQLAAGAYYLRWNNIQEHEVPNCGFGYVANAGDATGKGFDLTLDTALTDWLTFGLAAESVDVRYGNTLTIQGKVIVNRGAVVGGVPHVPAPWNGMAYLRYRRPIGAGIEAYARAENLVHSHNPGPFSELDPKSISFSPRYTADPATDQLNLQIGAAWPHCDLRMFVNNALNSHPMLQRNADSGASSLIYAYTLRPRTIGITGTWTF